MLMTRQPAHIAIATDIEPLELQISHHRECAMRYSMWVVCRASTEGTPAELVEKWRRSALGHFQQWERLNGKLKRRKQMEEE